MTDFIGKALDIGFGLEKKFSELIGELEKRGSEKRAAAKEGEAPAAERKEEDLTARERIENKIAAEGAKAVKELIAILTEGKKTVGDNVRDSAESMAARFGLATVTELEITKEMARKAREKADDLEKRLARLEESAGSSGRGRD
ncbi:MAG: accessory factor UbiK family protein [Deltaproteobacteria bacterium]|nr:accessory factor UbiK family protein [Deltaproteobacteria bacterium]